MLFTWLTVLHAPGNHACSDLLDVLLFGDREVWTPLEDYITNENYVQNT